jgi:hypothetical protein
LGAVEEATAEAEKHGDRSSELLTALVAEARAMIEQARAVQAERARAVAEEAAAAAAAAAVEAAAEMMAEAERLRLEEEVAALTLVMQSAAVRLQEARKQLGSRVAPRAAPAPRCRGDDVRGVLRRAQGPSHGAVRSPVREMCRAADQDENADVSRVPRAHPTNREGVLHLAIAATAPPAASERT